MKKSFIKVSAPKRNFICALCSSHRKLKYSKNLTPKHFVQIFVLTLAFASLSWSALGISSLIALPVIWMTFEFTNKVLYRKDIPCPHCGFDATWYRRDVKVAKLKVEKFWSDKKSFQTATEDEAALAEVQ